MLSSSIACSRGFIAGRYDAAPCIRHLDRGVPPAPATRRRDPVAALDRFEEAYIGQAYEKKPTPAKVTGESRRIFEVMIGRTASGKPSSHPHIRLHMGTVRSRGRLQPIEAAARLGLGAAATANDGLARLLGLFFERVVFHSRARPRVRVRDLATQNAGLDADNLREATLASGSIPIVMAAIQDIPVRRADSIATAASPITISRTSSSAGAHLLSAFLRQDRAGLVRQAAAWRRRADRLLDRTLFHRTVTGVRRDAAGRKVPDRDDSSRMKTAERQRRWNEALSACHRLGEESKTARRRPTRRERAGILTGTRSAAGLPAARYNDTSGKVLRVSRNRAEEHDRASTRPALRLAPSLQWRARPLAARSGRRTRSRATSRPTAARRRRRW